MRHALRLLFGVMRRYWGRLALGCLLILLCSALLLPTPFLTRYVIDKVLPSKQFHALFGVVALVLLLQVVQKGLEYLQGMIFIRTNAQIMLDLRTTLLAQVLRARSVRGMEPGYLVPRINEDTNRLSVLFADSFVGYIRDLVTFGTGVVAMLAIDVKLSLLVFALLPVFGLATFLLTIRIREASGRSYELDAQVTRTLLEVISLRELFKAFGREDYGLDRYHGAARHGFAAWVDANGLQKVNAVVGLLLSGFCPVIVLAYGGWKIMTGALTLGTFVAFSNFTAYLFGPTVRWIGLNADIARTRAALERIGQLVAFEPDPNAITPAAEPVSEVELRGASCRYERGEGIHEVSLAAHRGMKIGIVGPSGAGKTTLGKVLCGLLEPEGEVRVNGKRLAVTELGALRARASLVEQEPKFLDDSILENVTLGDSRYGPQEVEQALLRANAHEFVMALPDRLQTRMGDRGAAFSAGQRQRLAVARALLRDPDILVLDEGTASVDRESERAITAAVDVLSKGMIVFVIAHRLESIRNSDLILILEEGHVSSLGDHEQLLRSNPYYARQHAS